MPYDFYRKERPQIFEARFKTPSSTENWYGLKTNTVFQAKKFSGEKRFSVTVAGQQRTLVASVSGNELLIKSQPSDAGPHVILRISEANMHDTLKSLPAASRDNSILYQIAKKLCEDHATSSASSPLISGCIVDNFERSRAYDGFKLHVKLKSRQPFENPFVSGLEKEYFLIGKVKDTDCQSIHFFGRTTDRGLNERVNLFGSRIPRPG